MLIRKPSEQALPVEDCRLLLHNILEKYTQEALRANEDFCTHEMECDLEYSENLLGFDVLISGLNDNTEFDPVALYYQLESQNAETEDWKRATIVDYDSYASLSDSRQIVGAFYSNNWDGIESLKLKLNITEETAAQYRWRLAFRLFPEEPADYGDTVAFPARFTALLETALAAAALPLVLDDSPSYSAFKRERSLSLEMERREREAAFREYLQRPINARIVTSPAYHYRTNNRLAQRATRVKVERIP
jgi:hypothetical protein